MFTENAWEFGAFEHHTKGFGSKMMQKMGWQYGFGIGKDGNGRPDPIESKEKTRFDQNNQPMTRRQKLILELDDHLLMCNNGLAFESKKTFKPIKIYWARMDHYGHYQVLINK